MSLATVKDVGKAVAFSDNLLAKMNLNREYLETFWLNHTPEGKYYRVTEKHTSNASAVDWGGVSKRRMNEFVTADAFYVLRAAGRLEV